MLAERTQRPLVAKIILFGCLVLNKLIILLVDRVVGQVHELVLLVDLLCVSITSESCKALLEDIDLHRLVAGNTDVNSKVKFVSVDQKWIRDVL